MKNQPAPAPVEAACSPADGVSVAVARVSAIVANSPENIVRRAIEIQHTIEHRLNTKTSEDDIRLLVKATVVTLKQAISEMEKIG